MDNTVKHYRIYALIHPRKRLCHISRTSGKRLSAVYSRHICGSVMLTCDYFNKEEDRPAMYRLEELDVSKLIAYKHVLAWIYLFRQAGYQVIHSDQTLFYAAHPKRDMLEILEVLRQKPLETVLREGYLAQPKDGDLPRDPPPRRQLPPVQLNMLVSPWEKQEFLRFSKETGLRHRDAFRLLIELAQTGDSQAAAELLRDRQAQILDLERKNQRLRDRLEVYQGKNPPEPERKARDLLAFLGPGWHRYLQQMPKPPDSFPPLPVYPYKRFMRSLPAGTEYQYPTEDGFLKLRLEAFLWGQSRHRAGFLLGTGEDGQLYKLRWFPRRSYMGLDPRDPDYARQGVWWYVGFRQSGDGAFDLAYGCPMLLPPPISEEPLPEKPQPPKPSLNDLIQRASLQTQ